MNQKQKKNTETIEKSQILSPYLCKQEPTIDTLVEKVDSIANSVNKLVELQLQQKDLEKEIAIIRQEQDTLKKWLYGLGIIVATAIIKVLFDMLTG